MPSAPGIELPCVLCGEGTDLRWYPRGDPSLGPQPLHLRCAARILRAYDNAAPRKIAETRRVEG